jgi:hypothetical protein
LQKFDVIKIIFWWYFHNYVRKIIRKPYFLRKVIEDKNDVYSWIIIQTQRLIVKTIKLIIKAENFAENAEAISTIQNLLKIKKIKIIIKIKDNINFSIKYGIYF